MKKYLLAMALIVAMFIISSCHPTYVVNSQPSRPAYTRPNAPGNGYVWVDGDWIYRGGSYQWREGYWIRPNRPNRVWVSGNWYQRNNGWTWRRGHWR